MPEKKCWTEKSNENLARASLPNLFIWMSLRAQKADTIHRPTRRNHGKKVEWNAWEMANASISSTWFMFYIKSTELMCAFATRYICWLQLAAVHRKIKIASTYGRNKIVHLPEQKKEALDIVSHEAWWHGHYIFIQWVITHIRDAGLSMHRECDGNRWHRQVSASIENEWAMLDQIEGIIRHTSIVRRRHSAQVESKNARRISLQYWCNWSVCSLCKATALQSCHHVLFSHHTGFVLQHFVFILFSVEL